ncbi:MAG: hypothetical protein WBA12_04310, partial [Catalinimonas sp.]
MLRILLAALFASALLLAGCQTDTDTDTDTPEEPLRSPDDRIEVRVMLGEAGEPLYEVAYRRDTG